MQFPRAADTVVIGGGTSGAVVAGMLAEKSNESIVVLEAGPPLPEGTSVRVEVVDTAREIDRGMSREGGQYAGRIWMAADFDEWPEDLQDALGMRP